MCAHTYTHVHLDTQFHFCNFLSIFIYPSFLNFFILYSLSFRMLYSVFLLLSRLSNTPSSFLFISPLTLSFALQVSFCLPIFNTFCFSSIFLYYLLHTDICLYVSFMHEYISVFHLFAHCIFSLFTIFLLICLSVSVAPPPHMRVHICTHTLSHPLFFCF